MEPTYEVEVVSESEIVFSPNRKKNIFSTSDLLLEYFSSLYYMLHVIFMSAGPLIFVYIMYKSLTIGCLYLFWLYYDRDTPHAGGRRLNFNGRPLFWKGRRDYYPIKLVKTAELKPDTTYLFVCVPHGTFVHGATTNFLSNVNGFDVAYPGIRPQVMTLSGFFYLPITRETLLSIGCCAASKKGIAHILNGPPGNASVLIVEGAKGFFRSSPDKYNIFLKNRKGFVKVALASGASLVPTFTFGENNAYSQLSSVWYKWIQKKLYSLFGWTFIFVKGNCIFWPLRKPANTVVGAPIRLPKTKNPSQETIDYYHAKFIDEMTKLFNTYKGKYDENGTNAVLNIE